jgi:hypothetical protein
VTAGQSLNSHQRVRTPALSLKEEKSNLHHNENTAMGTISSIPLSEEKCWSSRRKSQKPNYRGTKD